jgi:hypothetical protein
VTNNVVAKVAFSVHPQRWPSFIPDTLTLASEPTS